MERVILPLGSFRALLTDNGKEFENELCHELCRLMSIKKLRTTFYTPQCNGGIECWHSTMNSLLAKAVEVHQNHWPERLAHVVAAYNATRPQVYGIQPELLENWLSRSTWLCEIHPPTDFQSTIMPITW